MRQMLFDTVLIVNNPIKRQNDDALVCLSVFSPFFTLSVSVCSIDSK